jgi:thymidylate synthase (FAD)
MLKIYRMVELLEVFGSDLTVVNAARVSFAKESHEMTLGDEKLITYLAKHNHTSPFFHPQLRFRLRMPIFVAREWYRHQIGFARNEVSRRYVSDTPDCWIPEVEDLRQKDKNLKQGSKDSHIENAEDMHVLVKEHAEYSVSLYEHLLSQDVAPEIARCVLPQSMMTEFIETGSLAAYARLYGLRNDPHAQKEIREYAKKIGDLISEKFPVSWKAIAPSHSAST